jgi:hypothetical protein
MGESQSHVGPGKSMRHSLKNKLKAKRTEGVAEVVESSKYKVLSSIPSTTTPPKKKK